MIARREKTLLILVLVTCTLAIASGAVHVGATSFTITLRSSTATQTAGYTTSNPSLTPLNPTLYSGAGSWSPAVVLTSPVIPPWINPQSYVSAGGLFPDLTAKWISSTDAYQGNEGNIIADSWRLFNATFNVPSEATVTSAKIELTADNAFEVFLNSVSIATSGNVYNLKGPPYTPADYYFAKTWGPYSLTPTVGTNTLMFVVRNWDNTGSPRNPSGLLYKAVVQYVVNTVQVNAVDDGIALNVPIIYQYDSTGPATQTTHFDLTVGLVTLSLTAPTTFIAGSKFYVFDHWEVTGGLSPVSPPTNTITCTVTNDGTATAHYKVGATIGKVLVACSLYQDFSIPCDPAGIPLGTRVWFHLKITFHAYVGVTDVVVQDGIGADLKVYSKDANYGIVTNTTAGRGKMGATKVTWTIGIPEVCQDYYLDIIVFTGFNPENKQEYTESGPHSLNSGPIVYFTYYRTPYSLHGPSLEVNVVE